MGTLVYRYNLYNFVTYRRSTPGLQPPPAHQQVSTAARILSLPFDLTLGKVGAGATPAGSPASPAPVTSGGAAAATVLDLSAKASPAPAHSASHPSLTVSPAPLDLAPHDFSLKSKHTPTATSTPTSSSKSKLDDTLSKLMQRKNCVSNFYIYFIFFGVTVLSFIFLIRFNVTVDRTDIKIIISSVILTCN